MRIIKVSIPLNKVESETSKRFGMNVQDAHHSCTVPIPNGGIFNKALLKKMSGRREEFSYICCISKLSHWEPSGSHFGSKGKDGLVAWVG